MRQLYKKGDINMRWILVLFLALWPSFALADGVIRPPDDMGAPSVDNPCVNDKEHAPSLDEVASLPYLLISSSITAVNVDMKGNLDPCPTDSKAKSDSKDEEHKTGDPWEDNPYLRLFPN
jgi:hypothetical protein